MPDSSAAPESILFRLAKPSTLFASSATKIRRVGSVSFALRDGSEASSRMASSVAPANPGAPGPASFHASRKKTLSL